MTLKEIRPEDFKAYLDQVDQASFMQSLAIADLIAKRSQKVVFLALEEEDQIKAASIVYTNPVAGGLRMDVYYGPIYQDPAYQVPFYKAMKAYAKEHGVIDLVIRPYMTYQNFTSDGQADGPEARDFLEAIKDLGFSHDGLVTGYPGGIPDWFYVKDLSGLTLDSLTKSYTKRGQSLLKKASSFGIQVRKLAREELEIFKDVTNATSERRDYSDRSLDYYQELYDSFGSDAEFMVASINFKDYLDNLETDQAKLGKKIKQLQEALKETPNHTKRANQLREFTSQYEAFQVRKDEAKEWLTQYGDKEVILAASLFLYTDKEATYFYSGSYTEFNKFYAPALLQDHVMKETLKRGLTYYNFLGIMGVFDGSDGVLRFKQNFNGYVVRKIGVFHYYPKPLKRHLIHLIKKLTGRL